MSLHNKCNEDNDKIYHFAVFMHFAVYIIYLTNFYLYPKIDNLINIAWVIFKSEGNLQSLKYCKVLLPVFLLLNNEYLISLQFIFIY